MLTKPGLLVLTVVLTLAHIANSLNVDNRGYIVYCPCMGRFGNQADQFLGALHFANSLDRTMVLPHWVEYNYARGANSLQIPFDKYFKVEPLQKYHRVVLMNEFMEEIAPVIWPPGNRTVFCYRARDMMNSQTPNSCNAKDGNPFGPFWDAFDIDFDHDEFFGPLLWKERDVPAWKNIYKADRWPVIAFTGAPAEFPVSESNAKLHKYLQWSDSIEEQADTVIDNHLQRPYIGAHLRIGSDWTKACRHISQVKPHHHLFATPQCLGTNFEHGLPTPELCYPTKERTVKELVAAVEKYKANSVFLASDDPAYHKDITEALHKLSVHLYWLPSTDNPHLDLALLAKSDHYIGNCVSSFSAFAARERHAKGLSVSFWAFTPSNKDEL